MIKLVAIDLDGTLLNSQKEISPRNHAAIAKAKAQGIKVVICTGRPLEAIHPFLAQLNLEEPGDYSITFNGGFVQKNDTGEVLEKKVLTSEQVEELITLAQTIDMPLDLLSGGNVYTLTTSAQHLSLYPEINPLLTHIPTPLAALDWQRPYNKAVIGYEQQFLDQKITEIPAVFKEKYEVIKSRAVLLEFMPKGVTKAYGLALLAKDLGLTAAEIMTIGDEENDLPMIEYAGIGVAMANAVDQVKAVANVITASNEEDGVAQVIEKYLLK